MKISDTMHLLYITTHDKDQALELAHGLVGKNLIACANILDNMTSVYRWGSEIESSPECVLICKTIEANIAAITHYVKKHHSYDLPCVVAIKMDGGNEEFVKWVEKSCKLPY